MEVYIAADDHFIATKLRACLHHLGVECPSSQIVTHESVSAITDKGTDNTVRVAFFVSQQFEAHQLELVSQLSGGGKSPLKVVAVGTVSAPATILQTIRAGAADYLDLNGNLERELREILHRLTVAPKNSSRLGQLFTVVGSAGGAGASLIAANLAAVISHRQTTTGLLDLHLRGGDLAVFLKCRPNHTLLSLAAKKDQLDQVMFEQALVAHDSGIRLLASPEPFSDYQSIRPELILKLVQFARSQFPTTIVDLEDCEHQEQVRILAMSEKIIVVLRPDFISLFRTKKLLDFLLRAKVPREHAILVANRLGPAKSLAISRIEEVLQTKIDHRIYEESDAINMSVNLGVPLVNSAPNAKVTQAIHRLAESLSLIDALADSQRQPAWAARQLNRLRSAVMFKSETTNKAAVEAAVI